MYEFIGTLQSYHIAEVLIGLSVLLILVDYYFPTDVPAHFGYFLFSVGMFFVVPWGVAASLTVAVVLWLLLAVLHQLWFTRFLTNAPSTLGGSTMASKAEAESQPGEDAS